MGLTKVLLVSVVVVILAFLVHRQFDATPTNTIPAWKNFGKLSDKAAHDAEKKPPQPFKVKVTAEEIQDYKRRLANSRFPPALSEDINMTYGFPASSLRELRDYMLQLNLTKWAQEMNRYDHYKVNIMGLDIHCIQVSGKKGLRSVPLLLIHGWPGSVYEFYDAIPLLQQQAEKRGFTYDIIVPSLPGYGFSEPSAKPGCTPRYAAAILNELMTRLGYDTYVSQGGDWGSLVTDFLVGMYPERLIGYHLNMFTPPAFFEDLRVIPYSLAGLLFPNLLMSESETAILKVKGVFGGFTWILSEGGYFHLQATKPDTLGASLTDSPLGLAAYIIEKFYTWTHNDAVNKPMPQATADLPFSMDKVLNNVLLYWHTNSITSSVRFYKEAFSELEQRPYKTTTVPAGVLTTMNEIAFVPRYIARLKALNLTHYTALAKGGHFAAFEMPEEYSSEVVSFTSGLL